MIKNPDATIRCSLIIAGVRLSLILAASRSRERLKELDSQSFGPKCPDMEYEKLNLQLCENASQSLEVLRSQKDLLPMYSEEVETFCMKLVKLFYVDTVQWAGTPAGSDNYKQMTDSIKTEVRRQIVDAFSEAVFERSLLRAHGGHPQRVFMSYSVHDRQLARRIRNTLVKKGVDVWIDEKQIVLGDSINEKISEGIDESDCICILLSSTSVCSKWVQAELRQAIELRNAGKASLMPILVNDCVIPGYLRGIKYADFRGHGSKSSFSRMIAILYEAIVSANPALQPIAGTAGSG